MKTYMIHTDNSYTGGLSATLEEFTGEWRALLEKLCGVETPADYDAADPEDPGSRAFPAEFSDAELVTMIEEANGDGTNITTVFEKAEAGVWKHVLG